MLDGLIRICLILWETAQRSSKVVMPFCFFSSEEWGFLFCIFLAFDVISILSFGYSTGYIVVSNCFNLHLPGNMMWTTFSYACLLCVYDIFFNEVSILKVLKFFITTCWQSIMITFIMKNWYVYIIHLNSFNSPTSFLLSLYPTTVLVVKCLLR